MFRDDRQLAGAFRSLLGAVRVEQQRSLMNLYRQPGPHHSFKLQPARSVATCVAALAACPHPGKHIFRLAHAESDQHAQWCSFCGAWSDDGEIWRQPSMVEALTKTRLQELSRIIHALRRIAGMDPEVGVPVRWLQDLSAVVHSLAVLVTREPLKAAPLLSDVGVLDAAIGAMTD
jgi:hypothetical protein